MPYQMWLRIETETAHDITLVSVWRLSGTVFWAVWKDHIGAVVQIAGS